MRTPLMPIAVQESRSFPAQRIYERYVALYALLSLEEICYFKMESNTKNITKITLTRVTYYSILKYYPLPYLTNGTRMITVFE